MITKQFKKEDMELTKNFDSVEFACKDGSDTPCDVLLNLKEVAINLQALRDYAGVPITINSGYRSPSYNARVGGAKNSQHLTGKAADITMQGKKTVQIKAMIEKLISEGKMKEGGVGLYPTFVHYDVRGTKARW